jgi:hypothetical protein
MSQIYQAKTLTHQDRSNITPQETSGALPPPSRGFGGLGADGLKKGIPKSNAFTE